MKNLLFIISVLLIAMAAIFLSDEYNRAVVVGSDGFIETGSRFGIDVGMGRDVAADILLARGFELEELPPSSRCNNRSYPADQQSELWYNRTPSGVICLALRDEKVISIGWGIGGWEF